MFVDHGKFVLMHIAEVPADMDEIERFTRQRGIDIIRKMRVSA